MNVLFILNEGPKGSSRSLNALRLACALSLRPSTYVRVFLIGSAASWAFKGKESPKVQDDAGALLCSVVHHGGDVRVCDVCVDEQGAPAGAQLREGVILSSLAELSRWIPEAERLLVF